MYLVVLQTTRSPLLSSHLLKFHLGDGTGEEEEQERDDNKGNCPSAPLSQKSREYWEWEGRKTEKRKCQK